MAPRSLRSRAQPVDRTLNEVISEVRSLAEEGVLLDPKLVDAAVRAWSPNTIRAFLSDIRLWDAWCRRSGVSPRRATADTVAGYIRVLSGLDRDSVAAKRTPTRAAATIERYLVHIGWAYRMAGCEDPTKAPLVHLETKAARKLLGTRQRQARGIRFKGDIADLDGPAAGLCLATLIKSCRKDMLGARDEALIRLAYDTGCRRSELVAIRVEDVEGPDGEGAGTLFIPKSKTDREREGALAYLSPATMRAVGRWRAIGHVDGGALFRRIEMHLDGSPRMVGQGPLHPNSISLIYKRLVRAAHEKKLLGDLTGSDLERWLASVSSHSIRVGVAQDNLAAGESLAAIMQAYRWRDPKTVMRYGAKLAAMSGAGARMAKRFSEL